MAGLRARRRPDPWTSGRGPRPPLQPVFPSGLPAADRSRGRGLDAARVVPRRGAPDAWDADWWAGLARQARDEDALFDTQGDAWVGARARARDRHDPGPGPEWFDARPDRRDGQDDDGQDEDGLDEDVEDDDVEGEDDATGRVDPDEDAVPANGPGSSSRAGALAPVAPGSGWPARRPLDADQGLLPFARRHLAIVVVALVVALCLAASYLFRARTAAVPLSVTTGTPWQQEPTTGRTSPRTSASTDADPSRVGAAGVTPGAAATPTSITVQVIGAVRHPGVFVLPVGSRVQDALRAAGGAAAGADPGELNLALVLSDADQVLVGTSAHPGGEVRSGTQAAGADATATTTTSGRSGATGDAASLVVDLNTATLAQLDALPGVGPTTAQRILDWRSQHGRFTSPQELQEVQGIGPKSYARLAPHVRV